MPPKFDPEKAENFEDVRPVVQTQVAIANYWPLDGEAVRGSRLVVLPTALNRSSSLTDPAVEHLMTYWSILEKVRGSQLRLTKMDDDIYEDFKNEFPDFDPAETIDEDSMKSKGGKEKWRNWMMKFEKTINDYNFGTIIRSNPTFEYDKDTTIFGMFCAVVWCTWFGVVGLLTVIGWRMQFYAIEIAR